MAAHSFVCCVFVTFFIAIRKIQKLQFKPFDVNSLDGIYFSILNDYLVPGGGALQLDEVVVGPIRSE